MLRSNQDLLPAAAPRALRPAQFVYTGVCELFELYLVHVFAAFSDLSLAAILDPTSPQVSAYMGHLFGRVCLGHDWFFPGVDFSVNYAANLSAMHLHDRVSNKLRMVSRTPAVTAYRPGSRAHS